MSIADTVSLAYMWGSIFCEELRTEDSLSCIQPLGNSSLCATLFCFYLSMAQTNPSPEEALSLFQRIETKFPSGLGEERWQILAVLSKHFILINVHCKPTESSFQISAVAGGGHPHFAANLYQYLIRKPQYSTSDQRKTLVRRLREALVKLVSVVGVVRPLEAIFSIADIEREEDKDYSFSRFASPARTVMSWTDHCRSSEHWQSGEENKQRGTDWLAEIYRHNDASTKDRMAAHKDFRALYSLIVH